MLEIHAVMGDQPASADEADETLDRRQLTRMQDIVGELVDAVSSLLRNETQPAQACLRRASALLRDEPPARVTRGGLAPWQIRTLTTFVETNIDQPIRTKDMAALARLSPFHFCRAFRDSFGDSPHGYLMRRRIERAQGMMLTTNLSLGDIAGRCGLSDQAHFNKLFKRFVGNSPGAWRRARAAPPLADAAALLSFRASVPLRRGYVDA